MPTGKQAALGFIFVTVLIDMMTFGISAPVLPVLLSQMLHGQIGLTSKYMGFFVTTFAVMQLFFSPIIGTLSDRFGRRPIILLSSFGLGIDYVITAIAPSVNWLFIGRILAGITSSNLGAANAYVTDLLPPEERSKAFGLIGAAFGIGFSMGPVVGGLVGAHNARLPFWFTAALCGLNAMYGFFVLPESLAPENRIPRFQWNTAHPISAIKMLNRHAALRALAIASFLGAIAHELYATVFVLYTDFRYHWKLHMVGLALAAGALSFMAVSALMVAPMVKRFGESKTLSAGLIVGALGFVLCGVAPSGPLFLLAVIVNALWGLAGPPLQALMTKSATASEQGQLQGALNSVTGISMIIGPILFSELFAAFIKPQRFIPGMPWFFAAALLVASLWAVTKTHTPESTS